MLRAVSIKNSRPITSVLFWYVLCHSDCCQWWNTIQGEAGISANERFISAYAYTIKFSCSLLGCSCIEANEAFATVSILECCHKTFL